MSISFSVIHVSVEDETRSPTCQELTNVTGRREPSRTVTSLAPYNGSGILDNPAVFLQRDVKAGRLSVAETELLEATCYTHN